jgi:hypothetical protein
MSGHHDASSPYSFDTSAVYAGDPRAASKNVHNRLAHVVDFWRRAASEVSGEGIMRRVLVTAAGEDVVAALRAGLSDQELGDLEVALGETAPSVLSPEPRRAEPVTTATVIVWVASGIVGGAAYDLTKKVAQLLIARFGKEHVAEDDDE